MGESLQLQWKVLIIFSFQRSVISTVSIINDLHKLKQNMETITSFCSMYSGLH